jgi:hypothetical protein
MRRDKSAAILAGLCFLFCYLLPSAFCQTKPTIVSTNPPNGATGVSRMLASLSMTFSKTMDTRFCGLSTRNWPYGAGGTCTWSADKLTMTLARYNPETPFASGLKIEAYIIDPEWTVQESYLRDTEGNHLDPYYYSFTIEIIDTTPSYEVLKIASNPSKGFQWPYYFAIPKRVRSPAVLLVEPNNTGLVSDDPAFHDNKAHDLMQVRIKDVTIYPLGSPILIPTFPRPASHIEVYTQALDANTLKTDLPGLKRIDLQLIAMISDAKALLASKGIQSDEKIFMWGFSASGHFTGNFSALHPELIKAAWAGGGDPIVPVSSWNGTTLPYPVGISDIEQYTGKTFDVATFSKIPFQFYVGDKDVNSIAVAGTSAAADLLLSVFGGPKAFLRMPGKEAAYRSIGSTAEFVIFPGMAHGVSGDWWLEIWEFFERNRTTPQPQAKPLLYSLYFPHVASTGWWETEVALTNASEIPIGGELRSYNAQGGNAIESIPVTIPAEGRVEITVGKYFTKPQDVAYLGFVSDSGFLAGYTRFNQPGSMASLALNSPGSRGWFPKIEKDGYTGIAFVNVGAESASVELTARDDNGNLVAQTTVPLTPGQKFVGMIEELFESDIKNATYCTYSSDKNILGFTVNGSSDGQMLDGLHALGDYLSAKK